MGVVAQEQQQLDVAVDYYFKALKIYEDAKGLYSAASIYHQLGMLAEDQQGFAEAIEYYQKGWEVFEKFHDWYKASAILWKCGRVLEAQENYSGALQIYICVLAIGLQHNQDWIGYQTDNLARMLKQLGESQFQAIWRKATSGECAGEVREAIWTARDRLG